MYDVPVPEALVPLLNGGFGRPYRHLERAESTQDEVRKLAAAGAPEGAVVLAEIQEKGRGRRGRAWVSAPGQSLTFSVLLRPEPDFSRLSLLPLAAGLALCEACGVGGLKWPNDLLVPDRPHPLGEGAGGYSSYRKLAGVLLEAQFSGPSVSYAVLGIGLNLHPPVPEGAAALSEFGPVSQVELRARTLGALEAEGTSPTTHPINRVELLARILDRLEARYRQLHTDSGGVLSDYRAKSYTLGQKVSLATLGGRLEGRAVEIAEDGSLLIKVGAEIQKISAGDVQMVGSF